MNIWWRCSAMSECISCRHIRRTPVSVHIPLLSIIFDWVTMRNISIQSRIRKPPLRHDTLEPRYLKTWVVHENEDLVYEWVDHFFSNPVSPLKGAIVAISRLGLLNWVLAKFLALSTSTNLTQPWDNTNLESHVRPPIPAAAVQSALLVCDLRSTTAFRAPNERVHWLRYNTNIRYSQIAE